MGCPAGTHNDLKLPQIDLLSPLAIRGVTLRSRIGMSPMCQQSVVLARELKQRGVDAIDVSSGGLALRAQIPMGRGYQVPCARRIRHEAEIMTAAVGLILDPQQADEVITSGDADLVLLGRELLREPYWALKAQQELGEEPSWPVQYGYAVKRRPT